MYPLRELERRADPEMLGDEALEARLRAAPVLAAGGRGQRREPEVAAAPQSPVSSPSAGKRAVRPSGATPTQLIPAPQVTATPQPRSVPARRTAKVSLRTRTRLAQPRAAAASCASCSSTGKSTPARKSSPASATSCEAPAASSRRSSITSSDRFRPRWCGELAGPRRSAITSPCTPTSARSVFELPPSTASASRLTLMAPPPARPRTCARTTPRSAPTAPRADGRATLSGS